MNNYGRETAEDAGQGDPGGEVEGQKPTGHPAPFERRRGGEMSETQSRPCTSKSSSTHHQARLVKFFKSFDTFDFLYFYFRSAIFQHFNSF